MMKTPLFRWAVIVTAFSWTICCPADAWAQIRYPITPPGTQGRRPTPTPVPNSGTQNKSPGLTPGAGFQGKKQPAPPFVDKSNIDRHLYDSLRDVINQGAKFYNDGDANNCYQLFRSSLVSAWFLLDHHADVRKDIKAALDKADGQPAVADRAVTLREALDAVRTSLAATLKQGPDKEMEAAPVDKKAARSEEKTLWDRLGKEENVRKVVDDFVALAGSDPKVNFTRNGKYTLTPADVASLKTGLVSFISQNTGGPLKYEGRPMKPAHRDMGITDAEFDASVSDLRKALEKNGAKPADIKALVEIVETTRSQIVESKTLPEKKPEEKKADAKKADGQ